MKRIPEPEDLMNDPAQALAYAEEDFSEAREIFQQQFALLNPEGLQGRVLDLGCGPADIPIALAGQYPQTVFDALDGARSMLDQARSAIVRQPGFAKRIHLLCDYLPSQRLETNAYDAVVSNSLLHHLRDPLVLWQTVKQCARLTAPVCVMDLMRPPDKATLDGLVSRYAEDAPEVLRRDFRNSLFAAYTTDEVQAQLAAEGLDYLTVKIVSDRHLAIVGHVSV